MHQIVGPPFGKHMSPVALGVTIMELSRLDLSVAGFFCVQAGMAMYTIEHFASEEQKARWLPKMRDLELISGWGLTEKDIGSDASNLKTEAKPVEGGYILNGNKRWIGNALRGGHLIVWARNTETKQIQAFFVETKWKGVRCELIKRRLAVRPLLNSELHFDNVFVPAENRLAKVNDFSATNNILKHSRVYTCWNVVGLCIGVYDTAIKYVTSRKQFNVPISAFQLTQEKLVRMMGTIQASLALSWRITKLYERNAASIGQIAMCKAWVSQQAREVVRLGRELLGGNGIVADFQIMKALLDLEAYYTLEGTYDINSLVAGREVTGIAAFKVPRPKL
eukprot:TRINITY_DN5274_c0_g2_i3.p1 TRINITY_DN5274_c0_g2~~TRINITY_DN5274_c0_g2_i3.p1  ORF type:complete len:336 (+),score=51.30 TRINITY_DN5274_c0_g2_i3:304-1311(+)